MAMASLEEEDCADLMWCKKCGTEGYLRTGTCVNSACVGFSFFPGAFVLGGEASELVSTVHQENLHLCTDKMYILCQYEAHC